jgi:hypothetical protein
MGHSFLYARQNTGLLWHTAVRYPDKFQAIAIGKKTNKHHLTFNLNGNNITCEDNVKLLGVTIDSDLNFNNHISEMYCHRRSYKSCYFEQKEICHL